LIRTDSECNDDVSKRKNFFKIKQKEVNAAEDARADHECRTGRVKSEEMVMMTEKVMRGKRETDDRRQTTRPVLQRPCFRDASIVAFQPHVFSLKGR